MKKTTEVNRIANFRAKFLFQQEKWREKCHTQGNLKLPMIFCNYTTAAIQVVSLYKHSIR